MRLSYPLAGEAHTGAARLKQPGTAQVNSPLQCERHTLVSLSYCHQGSERVPVVQAMCGLAKPVFRLPYVPLSYEQRMKGAKLLEAVAEHIPGVQSVRVLSDDDFILIGRH